MSFDIDHIRSQFPILSRKVNGHPLAYLDNAASAQKPTAVIDAVADQMRGSYANVHRGLHTLTNETTDAFEAARGSVAELLNAPSPDNIVFTRGATEALNLCAYGLAHMIEPGDEIVLTEMEHHSNIVPWHFLRERYGAVLRFVPVMENGALDLKTFREVIGKKTKIVSVVHMSNVLGTVNDIAEIARWAKAAGAVMISDGTQAAVHLDVDVQALGVDLYAMTGHKLYGPTAIGALYGTSDILERMQPFNGGGEMIEDVYKDRITYADAPAKFEAGTPPILEAIGLGAAIGWYRQHDMSDVHRHEMACYHAARDGLQDLNSVRIFGETLEKGPVLAFNLEGAHAHDVAQILDKYGVAVRAGQHCTQPLMERFGVHSTVRASFGIYNTLDEAERFVGAVKKAAMMLG
ncbi:MAG: cysteine desulfurase [Pseudomonadota bacterium]